MRKQRQSQQESDKKSGGSFIDMELHASGDCRSVLVTGWQWGLFNRPRRIMPLSFFLFLFRHFCLYLLILFQSASVYKARFSRPHAVAA